MYLYIIYLYFLFLFIYYLITKDRIIINKDYIDYLNYKI